MADGLIVMIAGAAVWLGVLVAMIWATVVLHGALKAQNAVLKEGTLLAEAAMKGAQDKCRRVEAEYQELESKLRGTESERDDLTGCLQKIGINTEQLHGADLFWREKALAMIRCDVDEALLPVSALDYQGAATVRTFARTLVREKGVLEMAKAS